MLGGLQSPLCGWGFCAVYLTDFGIKSSVHVCTTGCYAHLTAERSYTAGEGHGEAAE